MNAPKPPPTHPVVAGVGAVKNATSAGRSATLLVPAPNQRVPEVLTTVGELMVAEAIIPSEAEAEEEGRRPGMFDHQC